MSFRNRLALFFVLIVIVPMLAVAFLLNGLISDSARGKADAAVSARQEVAGNVFGRYRALAGKALVEQVAADKRLMRALQTGRLELAKRRARSLLKARNLERIVFVKNGEVVFSVGDRRAVAPAARPVRDGTLSGPLLGGLEVSVVDAKTYAQDVREATMTRDNDGRDATGLETIVRNGSKNLANTFPTFDPAGLPAKRGVITIDDREYRAVSFPDREAFTGQRVRVFSLAPRESLASADLNDRRLATGAILLGFFLVAIACAALVSRSLQQQIAGFLAVARKLAAGDFSGKGPQVPTVGHDEFAALGEEFNKMSRELERRLEELRQERVRVQDSMRRLGEAVASNLDRDALLKLVVRTAVDGVGADAGRARVRGSDRVTLEERSRVGNMNGLEAAIESVETDALRTGLPREATVGESNAIAHPLRGANGGDDVVIGVVSVGRSGKPFTPSDRDLFHYLAGQATRSMENVDLHETAARESITDDLTGLANRRAFDDALSSEIERAKRFGGSLGLVLIDLDNFKTVNDTYGHQQGDLILREVARVLRETSREIDLPARYGGEELAVVLPGTDLEGAFNLAERVRERIAELRVRRLDGAGVVSLTTSCGVAAAPPTPADERALVAAADAALYEAKRAGKNKSVRAR